MISELLNITKHKFFSISKIMTIILQFIFISWVGLIKENFRMKMPQTMRWMNERLKILSKSISKEIKGALQDLLESKFFLEAWRAFLYNSFK